MRMTAAPGSRSKVITAIRGSILRIDKGGKAVVRCAEGMRRKHQRFYIKVRVVTSSLCRDFYWASAAYYCNLPRVPAQSPCELNVWKAAYHRPKKLLNHYNNGGRVFTFRYIPKFAASASLVMYVYLSDDTMETSPKLKGNLETVPQIAIVWVKSWRNEGKKNFSICRE